MNWCKDFREIINSYNTKYESPAIFDCVFRSEDLIIPSNKTEFKYNLFRLPVLYNIEYQVKCDDKEYLCNIFKEIDVVTNEITLVTFNTIKGAFPFTNQNPLPRCFNKDCEIVINVKFNKPLLKEKNVRFEIKYIGAKLSSEICINNTRGKYKFLIFDKYYYSIHDRFVSVDWWDDNGKFKGDI